MLTNKNKIYDYMYVNIVHVRPEKRTTYNSLDNTTVQSKSTHSSLY